jgi:hypothetical protein
MRSGRESVVAVRRRHMEPFLQRILETMGGAERGEGGDDSAYNAFVRCLSCGERSGREKPRVGE